MQARKRPCQHFAGQVLVSGMPSGALTWTLRYVGDMCCLSLICNILNLNVQMAESSRMC
jgi:hypothetical protein